MVPHLDRIILAATRPLSKCHGAAVLGVKGMTYRCDNVARTRGIWSKRYGYAKCWEAYQNVDRD